MLAKAALALAVFAATNLLVLYHRPWRRLSLDRAGAVTTEHPACTRIGGDALAAGGSAVDAVIAALVCVGTVHPFHSGVGGGGFGVVRDARGESSAFDFRETAPAAAHRDMYKNNTDGAKYGGLAVAVPGELRGFEAMHAAHGRLPWRALFEPSIALARDGFPCSKRLAGALQAAKEAILADPAFRRVFTRDGRLVREGETVARPVFAETLAEVAAQGARAFYEGRIADSIVAAVSARGGVLTKRDLADYRTTPRRALSTRLPHSGGITLTTMDAPTSGPALLSGSAILAHLRSQQENATLYHHNLVESLKFAYAHRTYLGDPSYNSNITARVDEIVRPGFAAALAALVTNATHPVPYYGPEYAGNNPSGTTHASVVAGDGQAVGVTSTVNLWWGSLVMDAGTGVVLNDEMDDFSQPGVPNYFGFPPSPYNFIERGKKPLSSTAITIVENNNTVYVFGASGGSRILSGVLQTIPAVVSPSGVSLAAAINAPRLHHQLMPDVLQVERGFDAAAVADLRARGHDVRAVDVLANCVYGVSLDLASGDLAGGADARCGGRAGVVGRSGEMKMV